MGVQNVRRRRQWRDRHSRDDKNSSGKSSRWMLYLLIREDEKASLQLNVKRFEWRLNSSVSLWRENLLQFSTLFVLLSLGTVEKSFQSIFFFISLSLIFTFLPTFMTIDDEEKERKTQVTHDDVQVWLSFLYRRSIFCSLARFYIRSFVRVSQAWTQILTEEIIADVRKSIATRFSVRGD